ncbi:MAG TPA: glycosyltransferase [Candidatus Nanoarchaeia archaeon]|nr:glycosyltransferase [Candidatus Nanoarchaeia archaeon]
MKPNIVHVYHKNDYPIDYHCYGQTIVVNELAKYQQKDFNLHLITTVTPVMGQESFYELADKSIKKALGINVIRVPECESNAETMNNMAEAIDSIDGESILDYHFMSASKLIEPAKSIAKAKNMIHWHCLSDLYSFAPSMPRPKDFKRMKGYFEDNLIDLNIGVSDHVKQSFKYFPELYNNMDVVQNGVDQNLYKPLTLEERITLRNEQLKIDSDTTVIGYVGRMQELKGVDIIKKILQQMEQTNEQLYFVFASSNGTDRTSFFEYVNDNCPKLIDEQRIRIGFDISKFLTGQEDYDKQITQAFTSSLSDDGIIDSEIFAGLFKTPFQQLIDIYIHPARSEALGLSVIEAQMCGTKTIASYIGGIPEVITDTTNNKLISLPPDIHIGYPKTNEELILKNRAVEQAANDFMEAIDKMKTKKYDYETAKTIRNSVILRKDPLTSERMAKETNKLINKLIN